MLYEVITITLTSDGHGHLNWTLSQPTTLNLAIYKSLDGVTWDGSVFDYAEPGVFSWDCSGYELYFRLCQIDNDVDVLPYSNVVYSDGL